MLIYLSSSAFARVNNYKIIPTQELVALGMANIAGSFVSGYPVTGSFSRTAVNSQSGVKTPLAGMIFSFVLSTHSTFYTFSFIAKPYIARDTNPAMAI